MATGLSALGWEVTPGAVANFLLCHLLEGGLSAAELTAGCEERGLFLRDASGLGERAVRVAVKDGATNARMLEIIAEVMMTGDRDQL